MPSVCTGACSLKSDLIMVTIKMIKQIFKLNVFGDQQRNGLKIQNDRLYAAVETVIGTSVIQ